MSSVRKMVHDALRPRMRDRDWTPRASGWFSRDISPHNLGVIAVGLATKRSDPGTAFATVYVHLRDDAIERQVAKLGSWPDKGYRTTTATIPVGYLMPEARWHDWPIDADTAARATDEMADAIETCAMPYLDRLADDPRDLLEAIRRSPSSTTAIGLARAVVLLNHIGEHDKAAQLIEEHVAALGARNDDAALVEREVANRLSAWLVRSWDGQVRRS